MEGNVDDFGFIDCMDETNFEQFIEHTRGKTSSEPAAFNLCANFDCDHVTTTACLAAESTQFVLQLPENDDQFFDFNIKSFPEEIIEVADQKTNDHGMEEPNYSATTITTPPITCRSNSGSKKKTDRSRTIVSERKRRGWMKEKLYELRSLVPNITKMDKASIVGDAVLYVQELQMKANKLKAEIADLELSLDRPNNCRAESFLNAKKTNFYINPQAIKKIFQMKVFQVEEREFYARIVCNRGEGIATLLYSTLESLSCFKVHSSNLAAVSEAYIFTFTFNVNEFEVEINLPNLKLWIASALLSQGFVL
ncbi:hypothetical protein ACH5RR_021035 [Cinchona calisaya]|uniref:BHLH domain-containing protein n=1 Tax=Cinchona calisaya TaxID=153742 RepID=A0ABD2ZG64_9GENT